MGVRNRLASLFPVTFGYLAETNGTALNGAQAKTAPPPHFSTAPPEAKSIVLTPADFWPIDARGQTIGSDVLATLGGFGAYTVSVLVHAAMRYRATKVSEAPLMVMQENDDGEEWLSDHPLASILQYPNEDEEMADILELLVLSLDETGMALLVKDRDMAGRAGRLNFFRGDEFTVRPLGDRIYGAFDVTTARGLATQTRTETFGPDEVIFFRFKHPLDRWQGLAPVQVLSRFLRIEEQILTSLLSAIPNAVVPGMTIVFPPEMQLGEEQQSDFRQQLAASYASARNHGKPLVLGSGAKVEAKSLGFTGLSGGEMYREIESAVCVAFSVRPEILGMMIGLENSPWSHMATAQRFAYDEGIIPLWRMIERGLTRQLLRPVDATPNRLVRFDTTKVRALEADMERDARVSVLLKDIATLNQRRQVAGLEPEEGEEWDAMPGQAAPTPEVVEDPAAPPGQMSRSGRVEAKVMPGMDLLWTEFDVATKASARVWEPTVAALLTKQSADVVRLFRRYVRESGGRMDATTLAAFLGEIGEYLTKAGREAAIAQLQPLVQSTAINAARRATARIGLSFDLVQPGILRYAAEETAFLVSKMGETTGKAVAGAVQASLEADESMRKLELRLRELDAFDRKRALLVARTETTRATNGAQRRSMQEIEGQTGRRVEKAWISSRDERVRDEHDALDDGVWYPLEHTFDNGRTEPGEPNCRCTLAYRMAEVAE